MREFFKRRLAQIDQSLFSGNLAFPRCDGINRRFLCLVPEPPAPPIRRLVQSDAVDPGLQARFAVKMLHPAEDFQKYVLRRVRRIRRIVHDAVHETVDRLMKLADQPGVGLFRTRLQFSDDGGFLGSGPNSACKIAQCRNSRHGGVASNYRVTRAPTAGIFIRAATTPGDLPPLNYLDSEAPRRVPVVSRVFATLLVWLRAPPPASVAQNHV